MNSKCNLDEDVINNKIEEYNKEIIKYTFTRDFLFSIKKFILMRSNNQLKVHIEPSIKVNEVPKSPDLIIIKLDNKTALTLDHKYYFKNKKCENVADEISKLLTYKGTATYKIKEDRIDLLITDVILSTPEDSWNNISHCRDELKNISYLVYKIEALNIILLDRSLSNYVHKILPWIKRTKYIPIPPEVRLQYVFLREKPPLSYLLYKMYEIVISLTNDPSSEEERKVPVKYLYNIAKRYFPKFITTSEYTADQITDRMIVDFLGWVKKLGIGKEENGYLIIKKPKNKDIKEYVLRKLAEYQLCRKRSSDITDFMD